MVRAKNSKLKSENYPTISIVMPSFNSVDYIERAIRSVVEQEYPNLELFIKDADSQDGTVDIIKHYAKKYPALIRWVSEKDKGQTDAINFGMKKITGKIRSYLNSDDVLKKGALSIVVEYFRDHPDLMWAYGMGDIVDGDDRIIRRWITFYKNFWLRHYSYTTLLILNYISQMACFWRAEAAKKIGDFDIDQHYVMDYDYWLRLGKKFNAGVIPKYLASFRVVPNTKSSTGFIQQFEDEFWVANKYTNNPAIIFLHYIHRYLILSVYSILKFINSFSKKRLV